MQDTCLCPIKTTYTGLFDKLFTLNVKLKTDIASLLILNCQL